MHCVLKECFNNIVVLYIKKSVLLINEYELLNKLLYLSFIL
jgi:hypothetical protein